MDSIVSVSLSVILVGCGVLWSGDALMWQYQKRRYLATLTDHTDLRLLRQRVPGVRIGSALFWPLFILLFVRTWLVEPFSIPSGSMEPTLKSGDIIAVTKFSYGLRDPVFRKSLIRLAQPERGEIVVFKWPLYPAQHFVKRVVGVPGDTITTSDGRLSVIPACRSTCSDQVRVMETGGRTIESIGGRSYEIQYDAETKQSQLTLWQQPGQPAGQWQVPDDHFFVIGDNRLHSEDSRFWGFVHESAVVGPAERIILSLDRDGEDLFRSERIGIIGKTKFGQPSAAEQLSNNLSE